MASVFGHHTQNREQPRQEKANRRKPGTEEARNACWLHARQQGYLLLVLDLSLKSVNCRKNLPAIASREHCSSRRGLKFQQSWVPIVPRTAPRLPPAALDRSLHPLHHHIDPRAPHHPMEPKSGEPIPVVRRHPLPLPTTDGEVRRRRSRKTATTSGMPQKVHEANATVVTKICSRHPITILPMKKPMFLLKRRRNAQPRQEYRRASWGFATWGILVI